MLGLFWNSNILRSSRKWKMPVKKQRNRSENADMMKYCAMKEEMIFLPMVLLSVRNAVE